MGPFRRLAAPILALALLGGLAGPVAARGADSPSPLPEGRLQYLWLDANEPRSVTFLALDQTRTDGDVHDVVTLTVLGRPQPYGDVSLLQVVLRLRVDCAGRKITKLGMSAFGPDQVLMLTAPLQPAEPVASGHPAWPVFKALCLTTKPLDGPIYNGDAAAVAATAEALKTP